MYKDQNTEITYVLIYEQLEWHDLVYAGPDEQKARNLELYDEFKGFVGDYEWFTLHICENGIPVRKEYYRYKDDGWETK